MALGGLGWSPDTFWGATLFELGCALEGFRVANGGKKPMKSKAVKDLKRFLASMKERGLA